MRGVVARFRECGLPLDCVYLDVDYMDRYRDFTPDEARFPDLRALTEELRVQGVRLAAIVEAGIPAEDDNPLYREAAEKGLLCLDERGEAYRTGVWLGRVCLPDVLNPEGRAWFGAQFSKLTGVGVEGFWLDMNEPAIFYAPGEKTALIEALKKMESGALDAMGFISFAGEAARLSDFFRGAEEALPPRGRPSGPARRSAQPVRRHDGAGRGGGPFRARAGQAVLDLVSQLRDRHAPVRRNLDRGQPLLVGASEVEHSDDAGAEPMRIFVLGRGYRRL